MILEDQPHFKNIFHTMAAEKARFYLEKAVPELKEYEQKGIFNKVCAHYRTSHRDLVANLSDLCRMKFDQLQRSALTLSTKSTLPE